MSPITTKDAKADKTSDKSWLDAVSMLKWDTRMHQKMLNPDERVLINQRPCSDIIQPDYNM